MPTYAYRCTACSHQFDVVQKFTDEPLTECSECGSLVRRVFQPVGIVFKGSGWYINDSRKPETSSNGETQAKASAKDSASSGKPETAKAGSDKSAAPAPEPAKAAAD